VPIKKKGSRTKFSLLTPKFKLLKKERFKKKYSNLLLAHEFKHTNKQKKKKRENSTVAKKNQ